MKKVLIAGVASDSGKTTAALGISKALNDQYEVQSYKVGPDYVDTKFHTRITKRPARNLDNHLVPESVTLNYLFTAGTKGIDLGIVGGVIGLYDRLGTGKDAHSAASIAKQLNIPVILVINVRAIPTSAATILKGFIEFDPVVPIKGIIINNVMSKNHYELVAGAIQCYLNLPVLGYLPYNKVMSLPSRQLGLVPDDELPNIDKKISLIAEEVEKHVDLEQLVEIVSPLTRVDSGPLSGIKVKLRLGIAKDKVFNFYYADNLSLLKKAGVELAPLSPPKDKEFSNVDALCIGSGYPEEFAAQLAANTAVRNEITAFSQARKPVYAECGGLAYLGKTLREESKIYSMVGVFDGESQIASRLKKLGYCAAYPKQDCLLGDAAQKIIGREFHHSTFIPLDKDPTSALNMQKIRDNKIVDTWDGGYQVRKTFASYPHVHFYQSRQLFIQFLRSLGVEVQ